MKKAIVILSIALAITITIIILLLVWGFRESKRNAKFIKDIEDMTKLNDMKYQGYQDYTQFLNDKIKKLELEKDCSKREIVYKEIIKENTEKYNELLEDFKKTNDKLKEANDIIKKSVTKRNSIDAFALGGIDTTLEPDIYMGIKYNRKVFVSKLVDFNLGGGIAVKPYKSIGGAGLFEIGIGF